MQVRLFKGSPLFLFILFPPLKTKFLIALFLFDPDGNEAYPSWYEWEVDTSLTYTNSSTNSNSALTTYHYFTTSNFDTLSDAAVSAYDPSSQFYFSADGIRTENLDGVTNWKLKPATITHSLFSSYTYYSTDGPIDFTITGSQPQNVPFEISVVCSLSDNI